MDTERLRQLISKGNLAEALNILVKFSQDYISGYNTEIFLISSRFHSIQTDRNKGTISQKDFSLEMNQITLAALEITHLLDSIDQEKLEKHSYQKDLENIPSLINKFNEASKISSANSRLRTKNSIAIKLGEMILRTPELSSHLIKHPENALICGLCRKIQVAPDYGDISSLHSVYKNAKGNFTKGNMVNAMAEIIYQSKVEMNDDGLIKEMLLALDSDADLPLKKNIERVSAALGFLLRDN